MKKVYIKPQMREYMIANRTNLLAGSVKGVYGKIDGNEQDLKYGRYITEEEEEEYDPD